MKRRIFILFIAFLFVLLFVQQNVTAQTETETRLAQLEKDVKSLKSNVRSLFSRVDDLVKPGFIMYFFGIFCALWAQNTGRNPWAWFFLGLFFSIITVLVLLSINSNDLKKRQEI